MLRVVVGMDVARVATLMDRTPGSVRVLCHRGLKRLERSLVAPGLGSGDVDGGAAVEVGPLPGTTVVTTGSATVTVREGERLHA